jgi:hypothetical protein
MMMRIIHRDSEIEIYQRHEAHDWEQEDFENGREIAIRLEDMNESLAIYLTKEEAATVIDSLVMKLK